MKVKEGCPTPSSPATRPVQAQNRRTSRAFSDSLYTVPVKEGEPAACWRAGAA